MRRSQISWGIRTGFSLCLLVILSFCLPAADEATTPLATTYSAIMDANVLRAQAQVQKVKAMVETGTLARKQLTDAETALADAQDDAVLAHTLYGGIRVQDLSTEQAKEMVGAAERRVQRQQTLFDSRKQLVDTGVIAQSEAQPVADELDARKRTLQLAQDRARLLRDLLAMAETERALEHSRSTELNASRAVMAHYEGTGSFSASQFQEISSAYFRQFRQELPVSAMGQTRVHQQLGFDHRGRVDVAVNPSTAEGVWLRKLLEKKHISYIAFRTALTGSATGPHIHIGPGSLRVRVAPPPDTQSRGFLARNAAAAGL